MKHLALFIATILIFASASCAKRPQNIARAEVGKKTLVSLDVEKNLKSFIDATKTVRALVRFEISEGDEMRRIDGALVVNRPDQARFDAMDSLADVWAKAGSDGQNLWLYIPNKDRLYKGRVLKKNLNRLVRFDLEVPELISLISGIPPLHDQVRILQSGKRQENHFIAMGGDFHLWIDSARTKRLSKCVRYAPSGGVIDYVATFSDFRKIGDVQFPFRIEITFPQTNARAVVLYRDAAFGSEVDPSMFAPQKGDFKRTVDLESHL